MEIQMLASEPGNWFETPHPFGVGRGGVRAIRK
jgi:hypothetical protein